MIYVLKEFFWSVWNRILSFTMFNRNPNRDKLEVCI